MDKQCCAIDYYVQAKTCELRYLVFDQKCKNCTDPKKKSV